MTLPMHMGTKKLNEIKVPSCCRKVDSFENFAPQVHSSFIEEEASYSSFSDEGLDESTHGDKDISLSATQNTESRFASRSPTTEPTQKVAACCRNNAKPSDRKILDATITSAPVTKRQGAFPLSKSLANSIREKYNQPRTGTFNITNAYTYGRSGMSGTTPYNVTYPRIHVPRASRNYNTYDNLQPKYLNTQTYSAYQGGGIYDRIRGQNSINTNTYENLQPPYFSTPISRSHQEDYLDRSWGKNFSSIKSSTPYPDRQTYGARQDTFNATNQPSSFSRYARMIPTVDRLYANPNLTRPVQQNRTYNYTQKGQFKQTRAKSEAANRTFSRKLLDESAYSQLADSEMPDTTIERPQSAPIETPKLRRRLRQQDQSPYSQLADHELTNITIERPQSAQMQSPNIQRRFPQPNFSYERPHSAEISSGGQQLPACCRAGDKRPRTADPSSGPIYPDMNQLPPCCRRGNEIPKMANLTYKPKGSLNCTDNTCSKRTTPKRKEESWKEETYSGIQLVSDNTQNNFGRANVGCQSAATGPIGHIEGSSQNDSEEPLDTLLEIRTPHKVSGAASGMPFVLSINVSCADRSVVVTPDKGYKSISSSPT